MNKKSRFINTFLLINLILFGSLSHAKTNPITQSTQQIGLASYYSDKYHGRRTASGDVYDKHKLTAVHKHYPFGTVLRVTNLQNNRSVDVTVNDRAPLRKSRLLDLSKQAAIELGFLSAGLAKVKIEVLQLGNA
jgi:rare lipoprotein A